MAFECYRHVTACAVHSTHGVAMPRAVARTRGEPAREVGIVDELSSMTRRAWAPAIADRADDPAGVQ
jgi:hypothetical protein